MTKNSQQLQNMSHYVIITILPKTDRHPFYGLFSRTPWISRHQKSKTNLDCNEARDDRVAVASAGPYASHMQLNPDRQLCTLSLYHSISYRSDALVDTQPTASKHCRQNKFPKLECLSINSADD